MTIDTKQLREVALAASADFDLADNGQFLAWSSADDDFTDTFTPPVVLALLDAMDRASPSRAAIARAICEAHGDDWAREGPGGLIDAYGPAADAVLALFDGKAK